MSTDKQADIASAETDDAGNADVPPRSLGEAHVGAARSFVVRTVLLPAQKFIHTAQTGAIVLIGAVVLALAWANSPWSASYAHVWHTRVTIDLELIRFSDDLVHWINDGLMALLFLTVGLEVKREIVTGELSHRRSAALPAAAAVGGMVVPAVLFLLIVRGPDAHGWGIPVATDIAFALGVLALAGPRVPPEARTLLLALAAADDVGGILIIAFFYSSSVSWLALAAAAALVGLVVGMNALGIRHLLLYIVAGLALWVALRASGLHATFAGVLLGLLAPAKPDFDMNGFGEAAGVLLERFHALVDKGRLTEAATVLGQFEELARGTEAPVERIERVLHPWVSFLVLPLFALANAGIPLSAEAVAAALGSSVTLGVTVGLLVGKVSGVAGAAWLAVRFGVADLPKSISWGHVIGVGWLAGIGFTVSLFIADLAFRGGPSAEGVKVGILAASLASAVIGLAWLRVIPGVERS